jgi:hypothetical protein
MSLSLVKPGAGFVPPLAQTPDIARISRDLSALLDDIRRAIHLSPDAPYSFSLFDTLRPYASELAQLTTAAIVRANDQIKD